jgi:hypothetical protein
MQMTFFQARMNVGSIAGITRSPAACLPSRAHLHISFLVPSRRQLGTGMALRWGDTHERLPAGHYRGRVHAVAAPNTPWSAVVDRIANGGALDYDVRVARDGSARQTVRLSRWQEMSVSSLECQRAELSRIVTASELTAVDAAADQFLRPAAPLANLRLRSARGSSAEAVDAEVRAVPPAAACRWVGWGGTGRGWLH